MNNRKNRNLYPCYATLIHQAEHISRNILACFPIICTLLSREPLINEIIVLRFWRYPFHNFGPQDDHGENDSEPIVRKRQLVSIKEANLGTNSAPSNHSTFLTLTR